MAIRKTNSLLSLGNNYINDSPQPSSLNYVWNFGSLLALCLVIQIATGVFLAMHYNSSTMLAFSSVEHIMRDLNYGWLIRYGHANGAGLFFVMVYCHIGRGLYYGSYAKPRQLAWSIGVIIFILMIITGFLGYVLVWGSMSFWGATVITNLVSAVPWVGDSIVQFIWGGFGVGAPTLSRFFSLHYLFPFILAALALAHLIALHKDGSSNPLGISSNMDKLSMHPYFTFKDLVTIFIFLFVYGYFVFFSPNTLGHPDNYTPANPLVTPISIVPEFYLLPFYAILRSVPDKLLGVILMLAALLVLLLLPILDRSLVRGAPFRIITQFLFFVFICNFIGLGHLGELHIEQPFIGLGQFCTFYYFAHFFIIIPFVSSLENVLFELNQEN